MWDSFPVFDHPTISMDALLETALISKQQRGQPNALPKADWEMLGGWLGKETREHGPLGAIEQCPIFVSSI